MATKRKKDSISPSLAFSVGIALALLPWGLQMIGITVNLPLGAFILACALVALATAFWKWERTWGWPLPARWLTIVVMALIYCGLVGRQIYSQYKKDHPQAQTAAGSQDSSHKTSDRPQTTPPAVEARTEKPNKPRRSPVLSAPISVVPALPVVQPSVSQSGIGNSQTTQTMTNSPGGMQAGRDIYAIGKMPTPERIIDSEDIKSAGDVLATGSGTIEIITFPTDVAPNSEINKFATKLEYALSQRGWSVYRGRENHIGSFNGRVDMPYGPHGVGCATSRPPSETSSIAMKALAALKYHCAGQSVIGDYGEAGHFDLYITVGTRIVPEQ